jgi:hypothetical protein
VVKASDIPSPFNQEPSPGEAGMGRERVMAKVSVRGLDQESSWNHPGGQFWKLI